MRITADFRAIVAPSGPRRWNSCARPTVLARSDENRRVCASQGLPAGIGKRNRHVDDLDEQAGLPACIGERSLVKTAAELFIHRNSLMYRIKRIGEIVDVDLDDAGGRAYLLLSYELEDDERPANPSVVAGGVDASTAADISSTGSAASGGTAVPEGLPPK